MQKIPSELEARRAALSAKGYRAWMEARQANDFGMFESTLKECFDTAAETAECLRDDPSKSLYTTMLNEFERGMSAERIDELFTEIENALKPLLKDVLASPHQPSTECLEKDIPTEKQQQLSRQIATKLGFDDSHGRIDVSPHPFSMSLSPADVRITSRFNNREWYSGLAGTIHEAGHAMYEQGLGDSGTSVDSFLSMGCHESQSLFWERHVSLSKPFWKYGSLAVKNVLGIDVEPDEVYAAVNKVTPGFIRVDADELTYPLHVILRYRLERDVMEGKSSVSDIPSKWNQAMKDMLDVNVDSDANGCLQDVHW
jgi:carboxypeptidase Taq